MERHEINRGAVANLADIAASVVNNAYPDRRDHNRNLAQALARGYF